MASQRDYYQVLEVAKGASQDDIKRAYRKAAMKFHPDKNPGDQDAEQRFKEAAEAYEILSDSDKRARYDQFGHDGLRGTAVHDYQHMQNEDIFSIFNDIFGDMGGGRRRGGGGGAGGVRPTRGYDLETQTVITLEDVAKGCEQTIDFTRQDHCDECKGSGAEPGSKPKKCITCAGSGQVMQRGFGGMFQMVSTCPNCGGRGEVVDKICKFCDGTGHSPKKRTLIVKIPAGVHDGQAVRIANEGEPGTHGGPRGDLHVVVRVREHKFFQRDNNQLVMQMPVSFPQLALGADIEVPTLFGKSILRVPAGTQHGELLRIKGLGLPSLRGGDQGDLIIQVLVEIPRKHNRKQEDLLRQYADLDDIAVLPRRKGFLEKLKEHFTGEDTEPTSKKDK